MALLRDPREYVPVLQLRLAIDTHQALQLHRPDTYGREWQGNGNGKDGDAEC